MENDNFDPETTKRRYNRALYAARASLRVALAARTELIEHGCVRSGNSVMELDDALAHTEAAKSFRTTPNEE